MNASQTSQKRPSRGALWLAVWAAGVGVVWLVTLPWLSARLDVAARIEWLEQQGIDPAAMYYTELEMMGPLLQRLEARDGKPPDVSR